MKAKERFLKEITSATPLKTWIIKKKKKKPNSLFADMEKVFVV